MEDTNKITPRLLTAVLVLQGLTLMSMWTGQPRAADVQAAIPDPGAQREALVAEVRVTNAKLDALIALLQSGDLKVTVENEDDEK
jgi:hypothetical protein